MPAVSRLPLAAALALASLVAVPAAAPAAKPAHGAHGLPAQWQHKFHVKSAGADPDGDGLTNWSEFRAATNPKKADTNHDGVADGAEDRDRDGVDNLDEQRSGTDPARRDSDGDGVPDGREDADRDGLPNAAETQTANDPSNPDSDGDGIKDGKENAGRVVSWDKDTGELTLRLGSTGKTVSGYVDETSDVTCDDTETYSTDYDDEAGDAGDSASDDPGSDDSGASADDSGSDATAASAGDPSDDSGDDGSDDSGDDSVTFDESCFTDVLAPGVWVHEAELSTDVDGATIFDSLALIDESAGE